MKAKRYIVLLAFALSYMACSYLLAMFCAICYSVRLFDPRLVSFVFGVITAYIVFLAVNKDRLRVEKYKRGR